MKKAVHTEDSNFGKKREERKKKERKPMFAIVMMGRIGPKISSCMSLLPTGFFGWKQTTNKQNKQQNRMRFDLNKKERKKIKERKEKAKSTRKSESETFTRVGATYLSSTSTFPPAMISSPCVCFCLVELVWLVESLFDFK